jgi:hypothetical protein
MNDKIARFATELATNMASATFNGGDMKRARKFKTKLEDLGLLDIYHPSLAPVLAEFFAREFAAIRQDMLIATGPKPGPRRPSTRR